MHINTYIHTYTVTYIHTYIHTYILPYNSTYIHTYTFLTLDMSELVYQISTNIKVDPYTPSPKSLWI